MSGRSTPNRKRQSPSPSTTTTTTTTTTTEAGAPPQSLEAAIHAWYERHRGRRSRGFVPICADPQTPEGRGTNAYWNAMLAHARGSLGILAERAEASLRCPHIPEGLAASKDNTGRKEVARCAELADKYRASRFLRAVSQCVEVALDICVALSQAEVRDRDERETIPAVLDRRVLADIRPHLWTIAASMELRLFWDPRPFWTGLEEPNCHAALWKLYARIFLLASFDRFQALRLERRRALRRERERRSGPPPPRQPEGAAGGGEAEAEIRENLLFSRRRARGPRDMGVGPDPRLHDLDDADLEDWPMSILFAGLDSLTEGWTRLRYGPETQRFVGRCLLRYAMLGYATTPASAVRQARDTRTRCAHDLPVYCTLDPRSGRVGVNKDTYYGQGGAALREMLSDLCVVAHTDAWLRSMAPPTNPQGYRRRLSPAAIMTAAPLLHRLHAMLMDQRRAHRAGDGGSEDEGDGEAEAEDGEDGEEGAEQVDGLMMYCGEVEGIAVADMALIPEMRRVARRCFASMRHFLNGRESKGAEDCFIKTGVASLLLPGELWKFVRRWPDHGATPINIINGMRERDMILYRDHIIGPGISSIFAVRRSRYHTVPKRGAAAAAAAGGGGGGGEGIAGRSSLIQLDDRGGGEGAPSAVAPPWEAEEAEDEVQGMGDEGLKESLPGCLTALLDHLVWETARHMMRMLAIGEGTEALPSFLLEMHHARAMRDIPVEGSMLRAVQRSVWAEFAVWTNVLWESEGIEPAGPPPGLGDDDEDEEGDEALAQRLETWELMMRHAARRCESLNKFPPFPQIISLRGRMFIWNPLARPYTPREGTAPAPRDDGEGPDGEGGEDEEEEDEQRILDYEWVRECSQSVLVDVTGDSAPMALFLWLKGRRQFVQALVERIPRGGAQLVDSIRDRGQFKVHIYDKLALQWFGTRSRLLFYY